jgi:hypothetical protein
LTIRTRELSLFLREVETSGVKRSQSAFLCSLLGNSVIYHLESSYMRAADETGTECDDQLLKILQGLNRPPQHQCRDLNSHHPGFVCPICLFLASVAEFWMVGYHTFESIHIQCCRQRFRRPGEPVGTTLLIGYLILSGLPPRELNLTPATDRVDLSCVSIVSAPVRAEGGCSGECRSRFVGVTTSQMVYAKRGPLSAQWFLTCERFGHQFSQGLEDVMEVMEKNGNQAWEFAFRTHMSVI